MKNPLPKAAGTGRSVVVDRCQVCGSTDLEPGLFLGYMPPVNEMPRVGTRPSQQPSYPAELLHCRACSLVQLGLIVDPAILFPPEYPYTSGVTRILHVNFEDLAKESRALLGLKGDELVIDVGSNDGTLLSKFKALGHRVQGIEPTNAGKLAVAAGIPTETAFFTQGKLNGRPLALKGGPSPKASFSDGRLTLDFTLVPQGPAGPVRTLVVSFDDPDFYVAFGFPAGEPVRLSGTAECVLKLSRPARQAREGEQLIPDEEATGTPGAAAAAAADYTGRLLVACP